MSRVSELTLKYLDGTLSDMEAGELDQLLAADAEAAREYVLMVDIEVALRGANASRDLSADVLARLQRSLGDSIERGVMQKVQAQRRPSTAPAWRGLWPAAAACAVLAIIVFIVANMNSQPDLMTKKDQPAAPPVFVASVRALHSIATVTRGTQAVPLELDAQVAAADTIETDAEGEVRFEFYGDKSSVTAGGNTRLTMAAAEQSTALALQYGSLWVDVTGNNEPAGRRPAVITTPQARAVMQDSLFTLASTPTQTRLEVIFGEVELTRLADNRSLKVAAGRYAIVAPDGELASIPRDEAAAPDAGEVIVTGLTLMNCTTQTPIPEFDPIPDGAVIDLRKLPSKRVGIRANTNPKNTGSIRFGLDGNPNYQLEYGAPFGLNGGFTDDKGVERFPAWKIKPGRHTVTVTPYAAKSFRGPAGKPLIVTFDVIDKD